MLDTYAISRSQRADVITDMLEFSQPTLHLRVLFVIVGYYFRAGVLFCTPFKCFYGVLKIVSLIQKKLNRRLN